MIRKCLMKLSISWIFKHKERYFLSWVSFAIISAFFIFVFSIAGGISKKLVEYISYDFTSSQISIRNVRVTEAGVYNDLNIETTAELAYEIEAQGVRAMTEQTNQLQSFNGKEIVDPTLKLGSYYQLWGLMLSNDYSNETEVFGNLDELKCGEIAVSEAFCDCVGETFDNIVGKTVAFDNGESYVIGAVITHLPQGSFLNQFAVYIPDSQMTDTVDFATFDFKVGDDITNAISNLKQKGYSYSTNSVDSERIEAIASEYVQIGSAVGIIFSIICMVCLLNSLLSTFEENSAFMSLFRLLGLSKRCYLFMTCFTACIQGLIGGGFGAALACLLTGPVWTCVRRLGFDGVELLNDLNISGKAVVITLAICIAVSLVAGWISYIFCQRTDAEKVSDNELI